MAQGPGCSVEFPDLAQRLAYRLTKPFWQTFDHVAGLMDLALLDWRPGAEGAADDFAQGLSAVDDEQPPDLRDRARAR